MKRKITILYLLCPLVFYNVYPFSHHLMNFMLFYTLNGKSLSHRSSEVSAEVPWPNYCKNWTHGLASTRHIFVSTHEVRAAPPVFSFSSVLRGCQKQQSQRHDVGNVSRRLWKSRCEVPVNHSEWRGSLCRSLCVCMCVWARESTSCVWQRPWLQKGNRSENWHSLHKLYYCCWFSETFKYSKVSLMF